MIEAKRYEAVHLRYDDNNIRYEEGCEIEVVTARKYDELLAINALLLEALIDLADDYSERFDMESPSTNPGMKIVVENARAAIAKARGEA